MSYLNKEGWAQMATGTWQHHHRHLIKRHGGQSWGGETTVTKQPDCQQKKRSEDQIKEEVECWPLSLGALMQSNMWRTTPFPLSPQSNLKSVIRLHTHTPANTPLLLLVFHSMASPLHPFLLSFTPSPCWYSTLPVYFHLPFTLHSLHSLPNRQGCCRWHVSSWEQPCRVDGLQYTERGDSHTTQPSMCVFCVCVLDVHACLCGAPHRPHSCTSDMTLTIWGNTMCVREFILFWREDGGEGFRTTVHLVYMHTIRAS